MDGQLLLKEVAKHVNIKGLLVSLLLNQVVKPAVLDLVAKSENKLDDSLVALLMPMAEKSLVELVDKLVADLNK